MAGKGDKKRPAKIGTDEFNDRWDYIFNKDRPTDEELKDKMRMESDSMRDSDDFQPLTEIVKVKSNVRVMRKYLKGFKPAR